MAPDEVSDAQTTAGHRTDLAQLETGAIVEVMNPFTGEWRNGFVVVGADELGYVLSREDSHGARTPPIPATRVRAAAKA